jgi:hypothetical protein
MNTSRDWPASLHPKLLCTYFMPQPFSDRMVQYNNHCLGWVDTDVICAYVEEWWC